MVAWVVIDRRHARQSRKPGAIRLFPFSFLLHRGLNIWTLRRSDAPFHLPYTLPSSVSCNPFVCHSYENCRGVYQQFPFWNELTPPAPTLPKSRRHSSLATYSSSFFSNSCALFCAFLHPQKTQPPCLQSFPHSASKKHNHPGWGEAGAMLNSRRSVSVHSRFFFRPSTFDGRSRPPRDCQLSTFPFFRASPEDPHGHRSCPWASQSWRVFPR